MHNLYANEARIKKRERESYLSQLEQKRNIKSKRKSECTRQLAELIVGVVITDQSSQQHNRRVSSFIRKVTIFLQALAAGMSILFHTVFKMIVDEPVMQSDPYFDLQGNDHKRWMDTRSFRFADTRIDRRQKAAY